MPGLIDASSEGQPTKGRLAPVLLERLLLVGFSAVLLFGPLAFGVVYPWAMFIQRLAVAVLLLLWVVLQLVLGRIRVEPNPVYPPIVLFAVLVVAQVLFGLTEYRHASATELLNYVVYGGVFFLGCQILTDRKAVQGFALVLSVFGFLIATFALIQDFTSNGKIYWVWEPLSRGTAIFGTYVNRSHYAGLMGMLAPIPLVAGIVGYFSGAKRALAVFAGVFMATTLVLSESRGGIGSFLLSFAFAVACILYYQRKRRGAIVAGSAFIALLAMLMWIGLDPIVARFSRIGKDPETQLVRLVVAKDSLRLVAERPVLGWGAGVFPVVYPAYSTHYSRRFMNQAHNDFVQLWVETGTVGLALGIWFLVVLCRRGLSHLRNTHPSSSATLRFAAFVACLSIVFHSFTDFNMHIPANAALFFALAALATAGRQKRRVLPIAPVGSG